MSNLKHHGRISEVWKHLVVGESARLMRPEWYFETHAGSASYPLAEDQERQFGARYFRREAVADDVLASTQYYASLAARLPADRPGLCPGSTVVAMDSAGANCRYVLCDTDPDSAGTLRAAAEECGLQDAVQVVESDGLAEVASLLLTNGAADPGRSLVFIDPFAPELVGPGGFSALSLTVELIRAGVPTLYWYGYSKPYERFWGWADLAMSSQKPIWCADMMLLADRELDEQDGGDIGKASTPGTGSGLVLANLSEEVLDRLQAVAAALERLYRHTTLPDGQTGSLEIYLGNSAVRA